MTDGKKPLSVEEFIEKWECGWKYSRNADGTFDHVKKERMKADLEEMLNHYTRMGYYHALGLRPDGTKPSLDDLLAKED